MNRGVWLYQSGEEIISKQIETLNNLVENSIDIIFLSVKDQWLTTYKHELREFVRAAQQRGIEVHAITLNSKGYTHYLPEHRAESLTVIKNIINYCRESRAFNGIHIDTEVHASIPYRAIDPTIGEKNVRREKERLWGQYISFVSEIGALIRNPRSHPKNGRLKFSAAIVGNYHQQAVKHEINSGYPKRDASVLAQHMDFIVPMAYYDSSDDIIRRVKGMVRAAPTMIGIALKRNFEPGHFYKLVSETEAALKSYQTYMGIVVFDYKRLMSRKLK
jgi:hypothetical protein